MINRLSIPEHLQEVSKIQLKWIKENVEDEDYDIAIIFAKDLLKTLKTLKNGRRDFPRHNGEDTKF